MRTSSDLGAFFPGGYYRPRPIRWHRLNLRPRALRRRPHAAHERDTVLREPPRLSRAAAAHAHRRQRRVHFFQLPAGHYVLCAQVAASEPAPANSPYVDTCVWPSGQTPITLATGQQVAGVVFTAPKGTWLQVRVADPDHVLPQAVSGKAPALLEPELQVILKGPDGLSRHARFLSSDSGGRNYRMAIPLKTQLGLKITSSVANVADQVGNQVKNGDEHGIQPATPADLGTVNYTLHRSGH